MNVVRHHVHLINRKHARLGCAVCVDVFAVAMLVHYAWPVAVALVLMRAAENTRMDALTGR